jgi:capsular exopolysaccharide synthesis family protein
VVLRRVAENLNNRIVPAAIRGGLTITPGETSGEKNDIIELSFSNGDSALAREVVNELCRSYVAYIREVEATDLSNLIVKLESQINKHQTELDLKEEALREFKETHRMVQLSTETNIVVQKLTSMELALQQTNLDLMDAKERLSALEQQIGRQDIDVVQSMTYDNPFHARISEMELELNTLSAEYSDEHYKVRTIKQQIEDLKKSASSAITREASQKTFVKNPIRQSLLQELVNTTVEKAALDSKRAVQEQIVEQLNAEMARLPAIEQDFARLARETESLLRIVEMLKGKFQEARIKRDSRESDLKILELASRAIGPISQKSMKNVLIGILAGLVLGIGLAFVIEYLDQSIKEPSDIERGLDLELLGVVPVIEGERPLIDLKGEKSRTMLEPFRALRATIKHLSSTHEISTVILCSAVKGEGKTTLAANLAISFAMDNRRVLLVDADLRRSHLHTLFGIKKEKGLADYLSGSATLDQIIKPTSYANLSVVSSGEHPHNPSELLGTPQFDRFIKEARGAAGLVIFDSPALLPVSDAITMAPKMDAGIMVVRSMWTPIKAAKQAYSQLRRINARILGVVLNGISHRRGYYPYYYGYYAYKYSYEDEGAGRFSLRQQGLKIESGLKEYLQNLRFTIPRYVALGGNYIQRLVSLKTFWVLLFLFIALSVVSSLLVSKRPEAVPFEIRYLGNNATAPVAGTPQWSGAGMYDSSSGVPLEAASTPSAGEPARPIEPSLFDTVKNDARKADTGFSFKDSLEHWVAAENGADFERYMAFYDSRNFIFPGGNFEQWSAIKRRAFPDSAAPPEFSGRIDTLRAELIRPSLCRTVAIISKNMDNNITRSRRYTWLWQWSERAGWRIVREKEEAVP